MTTIAGDVAQGGGDKFVLSRRHDFWFDELISIPGDQTPDGGAQAGQFIRYRKGPAKMVVDLGGGYGNSCYEILRDQLGTESVVGFKGANTSARRTRDSQLKFSNVRTAAYWGLREALDPAQPGGSIIELPPDNELLSDLTAVHYEIRRGAGGLSTIIAEPKEKITKDLGRSPDRGDSVVMANHEGPHNMGSHAVPIGTMLAEHGLRAVKQFTVNFGSRRR